MSQSRQKANKKVGIKQFNKETSGPAENLGSTIHTPRRLAKM